MNKSQAQGAIEYLLIIGAAIIIAVIVISLMMGLGQQGTTNVDSANTGGAYIQLYEARAEQQGDEYVPAGQTEGIVYMGNSNTTVDDLVEGGEGTTVTVRDGDTETTYTYTGGGYTPNGGTISSGSTVIVTSGGSGTTINDVEDDEVYEPHVTGDYVEEGVILGAPLRKADGSLIETEKDLIAAYAAGEITINKNGTELSIVQKPGTQIATVIPTGCFGSTYTDAVLVFNGTYSNKIAKFISVNNDLIFESIIGTTRKVIPLNYNYKYGRVPYDKGLNFGNFQIIKDNCSTTQARVGSLTKTYPGPQGKDWEVELYNYELVFGASADATQIGINPTTGAITGITESHIEHLTCEKTGIYCYEDTAACALDPVQSYWWLNGDEWGCETDDCSTFSCDAQTCDVTSRDTITGPGSALEEYWEQCMPKEVIIPDLTVDYYH